MIDLTSVRKDRQKTESDGASRLTTSIGIAILSVSVAGLLHAWIGLPWPVEAQCAYALAGGVAGWVRMR